MSRELEVVLSAVKAAAPLLCDEAVRPDGPRGSGMKAPVDAEIGALVCGMIHEAFPDDHIICEEGGGHQGTSQRAFHIDPHDGTRDFLMGRRETSISVGLVDDGRLTLGVVYAPITVPLLDGAPLLVSWAEGGQLHLDGQPHPSSLASEAITDVDLALISTRVQGDALVANREALAPAKVEACASIATRLALVATGFATVGLSINHYIQSWDFAGGQALLQAAGGDLYDPLGQPIRWEGIHPVKPSLPGYFGARHEAYAAEVTSAIRPLVREDL